MIDSFKQNVPGSPKTAEELLDMYFLDARSYMLETAAILDRIERSFGGSEIFTDPRLIKLGKACEIIEKGSGNRAEQFHLLFSDPV